MFPVQGLQGTVNFAVQVSSWGPGDADADAFGKIVANTCMAFVHLND